MLRFCSLGSGSSGNATLVEAGSGAATTRLLLDCGFSQRELAFRLGRVGLAVEQLDAIFITHEHGDHIGCAAGLARRHRIPLWMSRGTWRAVAASGPRLHTGSSAAAEPDSEAESAGEGHPLDGLLHFARDGQAIELGGLQVQPYTVPHDAQEPLQVAFSDGARRLGVLTDAGCATEHILEHLAACDALLLECNHDSAMLAASAYPWSLKARIGGRLGHLNNLAAAQILAQCQHAGLRHVVAAHLSERNNSPDLARAALSQACGASSEDIMVADPNTGLPWLSLG